MQMNSLHSSCCLLRRFIWSRRHFKDFITVMVSQRNPTSQLLPRDGETCRSQKPARFYWITARVCLIKHEEHNDRTVCGWVFFFLIRRVHCFIVALLKNYTTGRKPHGSTPEFGFHQPTRTTHQSDSSD